MKRNPYLPRKVTKTMLRGAKPATFQGFIFNEKTGKMSFVCWPGVKFPRIKEVIILEKKRFPSADATLRWAAKELARRRTEMGA